MTSLADVQRAVGRLSAAPDRLPAERLVRSERIESGVALFRPEASPGPDLITHPDQDLLAYVLEGSGHLRAGDDRHELFAGNLVHVPAGTPHDFWASNEPLVILYALVGAGA